MGIRPFEKAPGLRQAAQQDFPAEGVAEAGGAGLVEPRPRFAERDGAQRQFERLQERLAALEKPPVASVMLISTKEYKKTSMTFYA